MTLLPLKLSTATKRLSQPIVVYETTGKYADDGSGLWQKTKGEERTIYAPVFVASAEEIQILTRGDVSQGGLVIHTAEILYLQDPLVTVQQNMQTFVKYQDLLYRVISKAPHKVASGFDTYIAIRYLEHGSDEI